MTSKVLSNISQKHSAQLFNLASVTVIILMPIFPLLFLWIAGSILVYSANIFHPNSIVREYTKFAGYRFYGLVGTLLASMSYSTLLIKLLGGGVHLLIALWGVSVIVVVPFGIRAILNAGKENWKETSYEV